MFILQAVHVVVGVNAVVKFLILLSEKTGLGRARSWEKSSVPVYDSLHSGVDYLSSVTLQSSICNTI